MEEQTYLKGEYWIILSKYIVIKSTGIYLYEEYYILNLILYLLADIQS